MTSQATRRRANGPETREHGREATKTRNLTLTTPPLTRAADRRARDPATPLVPAPGSAVRLSQHHHDSSNIRLEVLSPLRESRILYLIAPNRPSVMLGPAGSGWPRRPDALPRRRAGRGGATSPSACGARMRLGYDRHGEPGRPRWVRPGHKWPDTNALTTPTNYHHPPCRLKASSTGGQGRARRRHQPARDCHRS